MELATSGEPLDDKLNFRTLARTVATTMPHRIDPRTFRACNAAVVSNATKKIISAQ